jgi:uncharacterized protein YdaU (DUF1376 family)
LAVIDEIPLSTSAYLADTLHLSLPQHGAYLLILMSMWRSGGWIDDDDEKLARICKLSVPKWRKIASPVRALLISRDGRLSQKRLISVYEKEAKRVAKNRQNGSAGGVAKALKNKNPALATASESLGGADEAASATLFGEEVSTEKSKEAVARSKRHTPRARMPDDWQPDEKGIAYATKFGFSDEAVIGRMARACRDHHRSRGTLIADVAATWRRWVENEVKFSSRGSGSAPQRRTFADIARGGQHG